MQYADEIVNEIQPLFVREWETDYFNPPSLFPRNKQLHSSTDNPTASEACLVCQRSLQFSGQKLVLSQDPGAIRPSHLVWVISVWSKVYRFYSDMTERIDWADLYLWAMISARLRCRHGIITLSPVNMNWGNWTSISGEWLEHFFDFSAAIISYKWKVQDQSIEGVFPCRFNVACRHIDVIFNDGILMRFLPSCCILRRFLLRKSLAPKENLVRTTETILSVHSSLVLLSGGEMLSNCELIMRLRHRERRYSETRRFLSTFHPSTPCFQSNMFFLSQQNRYWSWR